MPAIESHAAQDPGLDARGERPVQVLVVDDEPNIRRTLGLCLRQMGCEVAQAATGAAAREAMRARAFDLVLLDLRLGAEDGIDLLPGLLSLRSDVDVVIITAYSSIESAVEAIRRGARDYLPKPFTPAQIRDLVERTRKRRRLSPGLSPTRAPGAVVESGEVEPGPFLETASARMAAALDTLRRAAAHEVPVLLRGEAGSGKGVLARSLHERSARRDRPFVVVNHPSLGDERLAQALFGSGDGKGALESAQGGTVLLDGLGDLGPELQARLLRLLRDRRFERAGASTERLADVRLVVATDRDLEAEVTAGRLGRDLLYHLNVMEIAVPPLRERREDVVPLARAFVDFFAQRMRRTAVVLSDAAAKLLLAWAWPGNVRELRNVMERALILAPGEVIDPEVFPDRMREPTAGRPVAGGDFTAEEVEREHVLRVLARTPTLAEASRILGMDVTTLWRKRRRWGR